MNASSDHQLHIGGELTKAVLLQKAGRIEQAEKIYLRILEDYPKQPDALHLLGRIYFEGGNLKKAKALILQAIGIDRNASIFHISLGDILQHEGNYSEAVKFYQKALQLDPNRPEALCNLGNTLRRLGNHQQAILYYQKALAINPALPEALNNLGLAYQQQEHFDAAKACFKKSISLRPDYFEAHNNLGNLYREMSDFQAAIEQYRHALALCPNDTSVNYNMGLLLQLNDEDEKAIPYYKKATQHHPPIADAYNNLGKYYQDHNQPDQAIYHYDKAIEIDPDHFDAQLNRALSLLSIGNFIDGWKAYEWRFKREQWQNVYPHRLKGPRWDGLKFPGKTLFIHSEQGFGDTIWFSRYLPQVKSLGGNVIFETGSELIELLKNTVGVDQIIPMSFETPPQINYDFYTPLMSLAHLLKTTIDSIPAKTPYIFAPQPKRDYWSKRIDPSGFNIGLVWAAKTTNDHGRSCLPETFRPLFDLENVRIYGLQKGEDVSQADIFPSDFINLGPEFESFADTAGAIDCLDLVISVDTSVAHLAGAMAKPVWVLLPFAVDWKWLMERQDSPWYPTMRLFRQPKPNDWAATIQIVKSELRQLIAQI